MAVSEDYNKDVSLLQEVKMQAQVLVPVLRALRDELGTEKADELVATSLRDWARDVYQKLGADVAGSPREKFEHVTLAGMPRIGGDLDIEWLEQEPDKMEFNVTGCRYAEFFRELGEPELGAVLLCESDFHIADLGEGEVEFERTQTLMEGANYCDFRYKIKRD